MKKINMWFAALLMALFSALSAVGADFSALAAEIDSASAAVALVVTAAILAGFGIFILMWGGRKIKAALSSGA